MTTISKPLDELTLPEINAVLEELEIQPRKRIDHARKALSLLIDEGRVLVKPDDLTEEEEAPVAKKPAREKKVKAERAPRPTIDDHDWKESHYEGRQVYIGAGTGTVEKEAVTNGELFYLVKLEESGELKASPDKSTRFEAVNDRYRENYVKEDEYRTASGAKAIHNGDDLATALRGASLEDLREIAEENGLAGKYEKYAARRNPGMVRMNIGLILRGRLRRGETVTIFGTTDLEAAGEIVTERYKARAAERAEAEAAARQERAARQAAEAEARNKKREEKAAAKAAALESKLNAKPEKAPRKKSA